MATDGGREEGQKRESHTQRGDEARPPPAGGGRGHGARGGGGRLEEARHPSSTSKAREGSTPAQGTAKDWAE